MARRSNHLLPNAQRQAVLIIILLVYFPLSCRAGNALQGAATSTISAVRHYAAPALQYAASTRVGEALVRKVNGAANTRLGQAMVAHYNAWNGVRLQFTEIAESNKTPYPERLFQQYIRAAQDALREIDNSAAVFKDMVSHFKQFGQTMYGIRVFIIHIDTPKSGSATYKAAQKIVSAMEKESKLRDYSKLKQIRGDYDGISLVCSIEEANQAAALVLHYNVNGVTFVFKRVSDSNMNPYSEELFQQYSTAAREALERIDRSSNFPRMLSHFKPCPRSIYGTRVFILVADSGSTKTGSETYKKAKKIVSEMESKLREDDEELREIHGNYNGVSVVCRIERVQQRRRRWRKRFRVGSDRRGSEEVKYSSKEETNQS